MKLLDLGVGGFKFFQEFRGFNMSVGQLLRVSFGPQIPFEFEGERAAATKAGPA